MSEGIPAPVVNEPPFVRLSAAGTDAPLQVRGAFRIGRNFAAHATEMRHGLHRTDPFFPLRNPDNLNACGRVRCPPRSAEAHHAEELDACLKPGGEDIPVEEAPDHVCGHAVALDVTRRGLQGSQGNLLRPRQSAKALKQPGLIGKSHPAEKIGHPGKGGISMTGNLRQDDDR